MSLSLTPRQRKLTIADDVFEILEIIVSDKNAKARIAEIRKESKSLIEAAGGISAVRKARNLQGEAERVMREAQAKAAELEEKSQKVLDEAGKIKLRHETLCKNNEEDLAARKSAFEKEKAEWDSHRDSETRRLNEDVETLRKAQEKLQRDTNKMLAEKTAVRELKERLQAALKP